MSSNIPRARQLLETGKTAKTARDIVLYIDRALKHMVRRPPTRKARIKARRITKAVVLAVKAQAKREPGAHLRDIGADHDIDGGRVSEILNGEWDHLLL